MDRGPFLRVRRALIRAGVVTRDMPEEEQLERASVLLRMMGTISSALRPVLADEEISDGDLFRRLGDLADAANERSE